MQEVGVKMLLHFPHTLHPCSLAMPGRQTAPAFAAFSTSCTSAIAEKSSPFMFQWAFKIPRCARNDKGTPLFFRGNEMGCNPISDQKKSLNSYRL
jgi:hypothetical protein